MMSLFSMFKHLSVLPASKLLLNSVTKPNIICAIRQKSHRQMKRKSRFTMPKFWLPRISRVRYPENLLQSNKEFVDVVAKEKYEESCLNVDVYDRPEYKRGSFRCGIIATKIGTHPMWTKTGKRNVTTLLHVSDNHVVKYIDPERTLITLNRKRFKKRFRRIGTLLIGSDSMNPQDTTGAYYKFFEGSGVMPKKRLTKFRISEDAALPPGTPLYAGHFKPSDRVDIQATTVDRGFQGGMKRWGFHGMPAAHGVTKSHRRIGSVGTSKKKIWPGKKMPGHMGRNKRTHRGIKIIRVDTKHNVIYVLGTVPGEVGNYCVLMDSIMYPYRRNTKNNPPPFFPTYMPEYGDADLPTHMFADEWQSFDEPPIKFEVTTEKTKKKTKKGK